MKGLILTTLLTLFTANVFAQPASSFSREGGGRPMTPTPIASAFDCVFDYRQQIGQDYLHVRAKENFIGKEGRGEQIRVDFYELNWFAQTDFDKVFENQGVDALLKGASVSMSIDVYQNQYKRVFLYVLTPSAHPKGDLSVTVHDDEIQSLEYQEGVQAISAEASYTLLQEGEDSIISNLTVSCSAQAR